MSTGESAIVVVIDSGAGGRCEPIADLQTLGLPSSATASAFESGLPITRSAPGQFCFELKKHDFKILLLKWPPARPAGNASAA